jgi:predicted permease
VREIRIPGLRRVLRASWSERGVPRDVDDEIRFHLDARTAELQRAGLSEREARARAEVEYGDVAESRRELTRVDRRRLGHQRQQELLTSFADDLRYAARSLARRPTLLVVTTVTLSLGIAANAIVFGVVDQLLLRPPAGLAAADGIKRIYYRDVEGKNAVVNPVTTYPVLTALREQAPAFSDLAAFSFPSAYSLGTGRDARSVSVQLVSGNYFRLLGVRQALGRLLVDNDDRVPDGEPVAIVSYGLWQEQFGAESSVIGRPILLQGKKFTVVGVAPRGFSGVDRQKIDLWLPISAIANEALGVGWYNTTDNWWAQIIGRIQNQVPADVAAGQATAAYRGLVREWKQSWRDSTSSVLLSSIIGSRTPNGLSPESRVSLWLMGVSGIVLLIACANVGNLLIARTLERRREIAVRIALGVSRGRLVRMLLTEAAVLSLLGSLAAVVIAYGATHLVQEILLPNIVWSESVLDARSFAFTLGITVLCMLLAGLASAVQGLGTQVAEGLRASSRQIAGGRGRLRFVLMLIQAALSVVLLVGSGLSVRSLRHVASREVGIDRDRVLRVTMPLARFGFDSARIEDIYRRGVERVRAIPGVSNVAVARLTYPLGSAEASGFSVPGVKRPDLPGGGPYRAVVTSGFFSTVGATIIRGRDFTPSEERTPTRVLIVNEAVANAYWPNASPIGQCARYGVSRDNTCSEVIGVVRNVLQFSLIKDDRALIYVPPSHPDNGPAPPGAMLVRLSGPTARLVPVVQRELQALAPNMPFVQVKSYDELVRPQLQPWRLGATMFTLFGVIAMTIAAVGLYSVMAYWVSQRTHEIGVRMALGARRADVVRLVAVESSRAVLLGIASGSVAALIASRWIADLLYETSPHEPSVYGTAALVLAVAAVVASIIPARRSTAVDPVTAIRAD